MHSQTNKVAKIEKVVPRRARRSTLSVFVVGGKGVVEQVREIVDSLSAMGFDVEVVGVGCPGDVIPDHCDLLLHVPVYRDYENAILGLAPRLVVSTSRNRKLMERIIRIMPPGCHFLSPFALETLRELRKAKEELGITQIRLQTVELIKKVLVAGTAVSTMVIDEDFKVLDINNAILRRTNMSKKGCIGRACHWVINRSIEPCYFRGVTCPALEVFKTGQSAHSVREEGLGGGRMRYFTVSGYPLPVDDRGKKSVLMVWKDVTAGLAPVLDRRTQDLKKGFFNILHQDKMAALGKLAAAAVHEINNPLQGILTFSKLMKANLNKDNFGPEDMEKFGHYLDLISSESARCGHILRNLLSFARLSNLKKSAVHIASLVDEVLLLVGNRMELQGIKPVLDIADHLPSIFADRDQIKQAVLNLVINAIEAMPNGGIVKVSADLGHKEDIVQIKVSDTGEGISRSLQDHVFEPFFTTKEEQKGVGLGLSVVYGILAQHGGTIQLQSDEGKGTVFILTFPAFEKHREDCGSETS